MSEKKRNDRAIKKNCYPIRLLENAGISPDGVVRHGSEKFVEGFRTGQPAEFPELHVAGQAEFATALHVERHEVHSELGADFLEQVVGDFLRDGVVHGLRDLVHQSHEILVEDSGAVQVVRAANQVGQTFGRCEVQFTLPRASFNRLRKLPMNLCALLHLSTAVGRRECPKR